MARSISSSLATLIASGRCKSHTVLDVVLGDGTALRLATGQVQVGLALYLPLLRETDALKMSLNTSADRIPLEVENVDKVIGQSVTGAANAMDGASGVLGTAFIDSDTGIIYYDEKLPGILTGADVDETANPPLVHFMFVVDIYAIEFTGRTVAEVFPFRDPPPAEQRTDPDDTNPNNGQAPMPDDDYRGRYPEPISYA